MISSHMLRIHTRNIFDFNSMFFSPLNFLIFFRYWTGYFSSRPTIKRFERVGNHFLQVCKQLSAAAKVREEHFEHHLNMLRRTMGVMQHHDAVTGTEKQHVANDYSRLLALSMAACGANTKSSLNQFTTGKIPQPQLGKQRKAEHPTRTENLEFNFASCPQLNISSCETTENSNQFMVTVYNPLAHATYQYVRVPVGGPKYEVRDYRNIVVPSQLIPLPKSILELNFRQSEAKYELVFQANEVPGLGYKSYFITKLNNDIETDDEVDENSPPTVYQIKREIEKSTTVIGNEILNVTFDVNGLLSEITVDGVTNKLSQNFLYYIGAVGDNESFENRSSGAYIFRPQPKSKEKIIAKEVKIEVYRGDIVDEVHQVFSDWVSQVVRVYKTEKHVEFEWMVGEIPIDDGHGKEIVSRFYTVMKTNGVFYTDSNGREMLKRKRNSRDTWKVDIKEPIAGNYYPVTTKIAIEDGKYRMAVLNDRAQGGSSTFDGTLELMVSASRIFVNPIFCFKFSS
jgi:lysosomal alpha-mannosidase